LSYVSTLPIGPKGLRGFIAYQMDWPVFGMLLEAETYIPHSFCSSEFKLHFNEVLRPDYFGNGTIITSRGIIMSHESRG